MTIFPKGNQNIYYTTQELREAFELEAEQTGRDRLLVTMAVPASLEYAQGFDVRTLDGLLDFFNLLTYDYHSSFESAVNHHAPLFRPGDVSEFDHRANLNIVSVPASFLFCLRATSSVLYSGRHHPVLHRSRR